MRQESIDTLQKLMVETYNKFGSESAIVSIGGKSWTGSAIAKEIEDETEFGIEMVDNMIQLTIDLVKRQKVPVK